MSSLEDSGERRRDSFTEEDRKLLYELSWRLSRVEADVASLTVELLDSRYITRREYEMQVIPLLQRDVWVTRLVVGAVITAVLGVVLLKG